MPRQRPRVARDLALSVALTRCPDAIDSALQRLACMNEGITEIDMDQRLRNFFLTRDPPQLPEDYDLDHWEKGMNPAIAVQLTYVILSHNSISNLDGLVQFRAVTRLSLIGNCVSRFSDCAALRHLESLTHLALQANPVTHLPNYRAHMMRLCSEKNECRLVSLDGRQIPKNESSTASRLLKREAQWFSKATRMFTLATQLRHQLQQLEIHDELRGRFMRRPAAAVENPSELMRRSLPSLLRNMTDDVVADHIRGDLVDLKRAGGHTGWDRVFASYADSQRRAVSRLLSNLNAITGGDEDPNDFLAEWGSWYNEAKEEGRNDTTPQPRSRRPSRQSRSPSISWGANDGRRPSQPQHQNRESIELTDPSRESSAAAPGSRKPSVSPSHTRGPDAVGEQVVYPSAAHEPRNKLNDTVVDDQSSIDEDKDSVASEHLFEEEVLANSNDVHRREESEEDQPNDSNPPPPGNDSFLSNTSILGRIERAINVDNSPEPEEFGVADQVNAKRLKVIVFKKMVMVRKAQQFAAARNRSSQLRCLGVWRQTLSERKFLYMWEAKKASLVARTCFKRWKVQYEHAKALEANDQLPIDRFRRAVCLRRWRKQLAIKKQLDGAMDAWKQRNRAVLLHKWRSALHARLEAAATAASTPRLEGRLSPDTTPNPDTDVPIAASPPPPRLSVSPQPADPTSTSLFGASPQRSSPAKDYPKVGATAGGTGTEHRAPPPRNPMRDSSTSPAVDDSISRGVQSKVLVSEKAVQSPSSHTPGQDPQLAHPKKSGAMHQEVSTPGPAMPSSTAPPARVATAPWAAAAAASPPSANAAMQNSNFGNLESDGLNRPAVWREFCAKWAAIENRTEKGMEDMARQRTDSAVDSLLSVVRQTASQERSKSRDPSPAARYAAWKDRVNTLASLTPSPPHRATSLGHSSTPRRDDIHSHVCHHGLPRIKTELDMGWEPCPYCQISSVDTNIVIMKGRRAIAHLERRERQHRARSRSPSL